MARHSISCFDEGGEGHGNHRDLAEKPSLVVSVRVGKTQLQQVQLGKRKNKGDGTR